jgi:hypothetical protein
MKKILVKTLALAVVAGMMLSSATLTAEAKTKKAKTKKATKATVTQTVDTKNTIDANLVAQVFDAEYYAKQYPDVVAVLGNDPAKLLNHYVKNGVKEGRDASATFNASVYAIMNPDLIEAFGDNFNLLISHYITNGKTEGRTASSGDIAKLDSKQMYAVMGQTAQVVNSHGYNNSFKIVAPTVNTSGTGYTSAADLQALWTTNPKLAEYQQALDYINNGGSVEQNGLAARGWTNESYLKYFEYGAKGIYYNPVTGETQKYGTIKYSAPNEYGVREFTRVDGGGNVTTGWNATSEAWAAQTAAAQADTTPFVVDRSDDPQDPLNIEFD